MPDDDQLVRHSVKVTTMVSFSQVKPTNLSHQISDQLVEAIKQDKLTPGQKLPSERELMETFKVGRSSVREALHSLVALKLVEVRAGKGYYVREEDRISHGKDLVQFTISERDFLNIMEAREALEPQIARLATQRALPEDLQRLEQTYADIQQAVTQGRYQYTGGIHLGITEATHNPVFIRLMETLLPLFPDKMRGRTIPPEEELQMHRKLIDGLSTGDGELMERLMLEHLKATRTFYMDALREESYSENLDWR